MSDPLIQPNPMLQTLRDNEARQRQTETKEVPPLYLPWAQQAFNPFPLASSATQWGFQGQPWAVNVVAFYVSVYVAGTNNGTNFWTIALTDQSVTTLASVSTAAISANTWTRLVNTTITQPAAGNVMLTITPTATGAPAAIYILPAVALLRTGN